MGLLPKPEVNHICISRFCPRVDRSFEDARCLRLVLQTSSERPPYRIPDVIWRMVGVECNGHPFRIVDAVVSVVDHP